MSFPSSITLQDATPADQIFDETRQSSTSTVRRVAGLPLDQPKEFTISHNAKSDGSKVDSLVAIKRVVLDADEVTMGTGVAQITVRYNTGQITAAMVQEDIAQLCEFLTSANVTKLLNQEH